MKVLEEKIKHLDNELVKVNKENKKLIENMGYQRRPPRIIKDSATSRELREIIKDLEDEVADLQMNLRSTEVSDVPVVTSLYLNVLFSKLNLTRDSFVYYLCLNGNTSSRR